jgi:hypothetical protein
MALPKVPGLVRLAWQRVRWAWWQAKLALGLAQPAKNLMKPARRALDLESLNQLLLPASQRGSSWSAQFPFREVDHLAAFPALFSRTVRKPLGQKRRCRQE